MASFLLNENYFMSLVISRNTGILNENTVFKKFDIETET